MNKLISELTQKISSASIEEVRANYKEYQKLVTACQNQLFKMGKILAQEQELLEEKKLQNLLTDTKYKKPVYAEISYESGDPEELSDGVNGSCIFMNKAQAEELIQCLVNRSYYYGHYFKWQGIGRYNIIPSWKCDHDGEVVYSATYKREEL